MSGYVTICLIPSLILPEKYGYKVDQGQNCNNIGLIKSARKIRNILVHTLMFADNPTFVAHNYQEALGIITICSKSEKAFGLKEKLYTNAFRDVMALAVTHK